MTNKAEILAPVGSWDSLVAAVRCGADAVYFGGKSFNARQNADNFDFDEMKKAVDFCHGHGVKVNVTLNTLIADDEMNDAVDFLKHVCSIGADVLILQDLGFANLVKEAAPEIPRHASTQMSVQTVSGIELLESLGYSRVVLPREMTKGEIVNVRKNTEIELEAFVHGAQCMCVSGQCYMSSMFGARSGNRGLCAQPCRLPFSVSGGTGHDLSLKDLSLVERVNELVDIGICSLKIEGRMKRPEYVAAAVTAVKNSLENKIDAELQENLKAVFSRSGFTDGYYTDNRGKDMFGIREKQDVVSAVPTVMKKLSALFEKERGKIPVDFHLTIRENENITLTAKAMGKAVFVTENVIAEKALSKALTKESLEQRLSKCGGTQFIPREIEIDLDDGLMVPASAINALRRNALSEIETALSGVKAKSFTKPRLEVEKHKTKEPMKFHVKVSCGEQIPENLDNVENLYLPFKIEEKYVENLKNSCVSLGISIPRGIFAQESYVEKQLDRAKKMGINIAYCSTIDAVAIAKKHGFIVHGGFSLNVYNSLSVKLLEDIGVKAITLSPELTLKKAEEIGGILPRGIVAYGRLPLMLTRNCPIKNGKTCGECKGNSYLTDRMGVKFPCICELGCTEILNSVPIYMGDRLDEIKNMDFITFLFTKEKPSTVDAILDAYRNKKAVKGNLTRGLYYRGAQ